MANHWLGMGRPVADSYIQSMSVQRGFRAGSFKLQDLPSLPGTLLHSARRLGNINHLMIWHLILRLSLGKK
jgi:hypothetical protein